MKICPLHIVYATDQRYLFPTQVAAGSAVALASRRENVCIDILDCGVPDHDWERFQREMRIKFGDAFGLVRHIVDISRFKDYPSWHHSKGLYARFEIPRFLQEADWCVYCDGDTLFTDDPLKLDIFFDDWYALGGHKDDFDDNQRKWHEDRELPFDVNQRICSGFLIMNLKWFRENNGAERCLKFVEAYPDVVFPDQDALNYVCLNKIWTLPDEWGRFTYKTKADIQPGCLHYVAQRPWEMKYNGRMPVTSCQRLWIKYMWRFVGAWRCEKSRTYYYAQFAKTMLWRWLYKIANMVPGHKGRYDWVKDVIWDARIFNRFAPQKYNRKDDNYL